MYIFYVTLKYSQLKWWFTVIPQILKQSDKIATNFDRMLRGAAELNLRKALLGWVISLGNGDIEIVVPGHVQKEYGI